MPLRKLTEGVSPSWVYHWILTNDILPVHRWPDHLQRHCWPSCRDKNPSFGLSSEVLALGRSPFDSKMAQRAEQEERLKSAKVKAWQPTGTPPGHLHLVVFQACYTGWRSCSRLRTFLIDHMFHLAWGSLRSHHGEPWKTLLDKEAVWKATS